MTNNILPHILLVEDDDSLSDWIAEYLRLRDFKVTQTARGDKAVELIKSLNPDIVLLDGMLPGMDGIDVCKTVRPEFSNAIIMITARDEEVDEVLGLEMGADDFLVKPVRARALLSRIKLLLKKQQQKQLQQQEIVDAKLQSRNSSLSSETLSEQHLQFNGLLINASSREVVLNNQVINVSSKEFDVLWFIAKNAGQLVSREQLVAELRGFEYNGFDRSIDLQISRLRKKLKDDANNPFRIKTVWGKGYMFVKDAW